MNQPNAIFPNETYLNGLRVGDATVVDALYNEFRQSVARAVEFAGGSYADGGTFFRVAIIQTAQIVQTGLYPENAPIFFYLKNLAIAQYRNWLKEKGQEIPLAPVPTEEEIPVMHVLPEEESLRLLRQQIRAKRQFTRLSTADQRQILSLANSIAGGQLGPSTIDNQLIAGSLARYKKLLEDSESDWDNTLPDWIVTPLTDQHFQLIWSACEAVERRLASSQVPTSGPNKAVLYAFIAFTLLTIGYAAYVWFSRDQTPTEVYENNFQPPASILEDLRARYSRDSISPSRPEACNQAFREADEHYKKKDYRESAAVLASVLEDSLSVCQSDALFYLGIVGLHLDRPELTLECISKIEDLERFGEDIYWYMALAYVKIAADDPSEKDIARRALERALSNTEIPERRTQAEKMLEDLSE